MKPKFRSLIASFSPLSRISVVVCASLCAVASVQAQSGTWTSLDSGGNWSDLPNWNNGAGPVADGAGNTANFSAIDLPEGPFTVNLLASRTIGSVNFGDSDSFTTPGTWNLAGTATLTLAGTAPTITAGVNATIAPVIAGSEGLTKAGPASLTLSAANTFTGSLSVNAGNLTLSSSNAYTGGTTINSGGTLTLGLGTNFSNGGIGVGTVAFNGGSLNSTMGNNNALVYANAISIESGKTGTINTPNRFEMTGAVTGAGTLSMNIISNVERADFRNNFSDFSGNLNFTGGGGMRLRINQSAPAYNAAGMLNTKLDLGGSTYFTVITNSGGNTVSIGSLSGSSATASLRGGNNGAATYSVGSLGLDTAFAGSIQANAALTKVGAGTLTLTGGNTYTGATNVSAGTLDIGGGGTSGSLGSTNITVAPGAALVFNTSGAQAVGGVLAGAGGVSKRGPGSTRLTGENTFSGELFIEGGDLIIIASGNLGSAAGTLSFPTGTGKLVSDATAIVVARPVAVQAGATAGFAGLDPLDSIQFDNAITGDGAVQISGNGLVRLAVANSYLGSTTVTSGTLSVSVAGATSSGSVSVTGGSLGGAGSITGATSISSGAAIKPGAVTTSSSSVGTLTTGSLTLAGGSMLHAEFVNASSYDKVLVNGNLLTSGASVETPVLVDLRLENSLAKWTTPGTYNLIQYTGTFTGNANDLFEVSPDSVQSGLTYTFAASGGSINLTISGTAPSEWNVNANGLWSGAGNWLNGIPNATDATANFGAIISAPRTVTVDSPRTVGAIQFSNANTYTVAGASALSLSVSSGNAGISVLEGSHIISAPISLANPLSLTMLTPANTLDLSGNITGGGGISNNTPGSLILRGTNTFGGNVNFSAGTLTFNAGSLGNGSLTLANSTLVWGAGNTQDISNRTITLGGTGVTLDTNGNNVLLANSVGNSGSANFTKTGAGSLILAANPSYAGATTVSGGTLQLGNGGVTGIVNGAITNNAQLAINYASGSSLANQVVGTGSLVHAGSGSLTLLAENTFSGTTSITSASGVLTFGETLNLQNSTLQYASSGGSINWNSLGAVTLGGLSGSKNLALDNIDEFPVALTIGNNGTETFYSGALSGSGSLTKVGAGRSILGGLNTYFGATTVSAGDLDLTYGGSITSALTVNGSGRMVVSGGDLYVSSNALAVNSGGFYMSDGTADFATTLFANGSNGSSNSALIKVEGGVLNAPSIVLGRTGENQFEAAADRNLYMTGGEVNVSGNLLIGTSSSQPNSTVVTRVDGGVLTVGGAISVGLNNGGRRSILSVNGGTLVSTGTGLNSGVVLGGPWAGQAAFHMENGLAEVERIQFGQGAVNGFGLLRVTGGELYVGSGGITLESTGSFPTEIQLAGGRLGAKASWTSSLPVIVGGNPFVPSYIHAADLMGNPFNIELSGALTGTGSLSKDGAGILILSGGNSYAGDTTVEQGKLVLTTSTLNDVASVTVFSGAVLELGFSGGDRVGTLILGNNFMPDGIYGRVGTNQPGVTESSLIEGNGLLYVGVDLPPSGGYEAWATDPANGLTAGVNDGPTQDPDNDGITNLMEFVLGGNPTVPSTSVLPKLTVTATSFVFTFNRNDDSESEVGLNFQHGANLTTWTDVVIGADNASSGSEVSIVENGTDPDAVTVTIPKGSSTKLFGRLKVVK